MNYSYGFFILGAVAKYLCCDSRRPATLLRIPPSRIICGPIGIFVCLRRTS